MAVFLLLITLIIPLNNLYKSTKILKFYQRKEFLGESLKSNKRDSSIIILLPCLNEQPLVNETLNYFVNLEKISNCYIVPITGDSENEINKSKKNQMDKIVTLWWKVFNKYIFKFTNNGLFPLDYFDKLKNIRNKSDNLEDYNGLVQELLKKEKSTKYLIEEWIKYNPIKSDQIIHLNEKSKFGTKSTKLNFAIEELINANILTTDTYIGVYDFDARPHKDTLLWIQDFISKVEKLPDVIQQVPMPLGKGIYNKSDSISFIFISAIWHLERALGIESNIYYKKYRNKKKNSYSSLMYLMGSGMFLRKEKLVQLDLFPIDSDDLALGYKYDWLNLDREVIPFPNIVMPSPSIISQFKQMRRVILGCFTYEREYKLVQNQISYSKIKKTVRIISTLFFIVYPCIIFFVLTTLFILLITNYGFWISMFVIILIYLYFCCIFFIYFKISENFKFIDLRKRFLILNLLLSPVLYSLIRTIVLTEILFKFIFFRKNLKSFAAQKSER